MPLQNRVDPFGVLHTNDARGLFMGNRGGRFHDVRTQSLGGKHWASKHWIICVCQLKGRHRNVWGIQSSGKPSYTELFFLDEVTALAAGHRPCFECRRQAAKAYAAGFSKVTGIANPKVADMDDMLSAERLASKETPRSISEDDLLKLPDGAMIATDGVPHALKGGKWLPWSFNGYGKAARLASGQALTLITPPTTIAVLQAGYIPVWHPSAQANVD